MKHFVQLLENLSKDKSALSKENMLQDFFSTEDSNNDKDSTLNLLFGNTPKRIIQTRKLKDWATELTGFPEWLIERSEQEVGNFVQAFNLLLRSNDSDLEDKNLTDWLSEIRLLYNESEENIKEFVRDELLRVEEPGRLILLKLLTGTFKSPVSKYELVVSISQVMELRTEIISLRLYECEKNQHISMADLKQQIAGERMNIPLDFPVIKPTNQPFELSNNWEVFGKKDGIEAQLIKYGNSILLWTKQPELITDKFPEIIDSIPSSTPNFKSFGQILPKNQDIPIEQLTSRINKKNTTKKDIAHTEAKFEIWTILEGNTKNIMPELLDQPNITTQNTIETSSKEKLVSIHKSCRNHGFSGLILKQKNNPDYLYWKANSFSVKALLTYVEFGGMSNTGIRSMTFGIYKGDEIVPIAKISDFDTKQDTQEVVKYVKENTIERFGPVRTIKPQLVYELYFDGITKSSRRKSGLILTNPQIKKKVGQDAKLANTLEYLLGLL